MDESRLSALRAELNKIHKWPSQYMFKFIVPSFEERVTAVKLIFGESAHFEMKWSANGKYTAITVHAMMMNVDEIFEKYEEAAKIEGIISL
ncbi:MAG: hypothetical protein RLZZ71_1602 [Bacteroidota bacterium]|jgi:putative lipoic acid-binding regulatory protein